MEHPIKNPEMENLAKIAARLWNDKEARANLASGILKRHKLKAWEARALSERAHFLSVQFEIAKKHKLPLGHLAYSWQDQQEVAA